MSRLKLPLETRRLCLREFTDDDLAAITALYCDKRVTRHMLYGPRDKASAKRYLASVIGACDLTLHCREEAEIGYLIAPAQWRQGYATETAAALAGAAFEQLRVDRILSTVEIHNKRSLRVLDKAGLRWEATFRRYARSRKHWWDVHLYAISREDWALARE